MFENELMEKDRKKRCIKIFGTEHTIKIKTNEKHDLGKDEYLSFMFDHVFSEDATNEDIFDQSVKKLVDSAI